jgi:Zn-dependent peptidase ImmA (M78 family)
MPELAHVLLEHEPAKVILSYDGSIVMRTFDARQEEEAGWLAGCLLLPRVALLRAVRARQTSAEIAEVFGVTEVLTNYRIRICGVDAQVRPLPRRGGRKREGPGRRLARTSLTGRSKALPGKSHEE